MVSQGLDNMQADKVATKLLLAKSKNIRSSYLPLLGQSAMHRCF